MDDETPDATPAEEAAEDQQNTEETCEDARSRLAGELLVAERQRAFLGDRLQLTTERLLGEKLASGEIRAVEVVPLLNRELSDVNATLNQIAAA